jgi:hypothetical protein
MNVTCAMLLQMPPLLLLLLLLLHLADAAQRPQNKTGLRDVPIAPDVCGGSATGSAHQYLDSDTAWTATSATGEEISAAVPGDIISDLHAAGKIANPFFETTWKNSSLWKGNLWTYSTHFQRPASAEGGGAVLLVFDGLKMGAEISLNGHKLGNATDQFARYQYDVTKLLKHGAGATNALQLSFSNAIDTAGRFMTCSGEADWAPYSDTFQHSAILGAGSKRMPTFSFGIWKSVSLVVVQRAAISERLSCTRLSSCVNDSQLYHIAVRLL